MGETPSTTSVDVTALDGLVNVNSLFTIAVFVGLSLTSPGQRSLEGNSACDAGQDVIRNLLVFEVVSFSFFLFSSLVAQGLKLAINLLNSNDVDEAFRAHINVRALRLGMLTSAIGSMMGCIFLLLSVPAGESLRRHRVGGEETRPPQSGQPAPPLRLPPRQLCLLLRRQLVRLQHFSSPFSLLLLSLILLFLLFCFASVLVFWNDLQR